MPVPKSTVENSPRKLLRDVVLEKMLAAIQDGTLQAGERLNDDELVQWLGVSRTPIREAIAKLVDYGLVEMEANRYTRVASPTAKQFDDTIQVLAGVTELAARWAVPKLDDAAATRLVDTLEALRTAAEQERAGDVSTQVGAVVTQLIGAADNDLLVQLSTSLLPRANFLALTHQSGMFWDVKHFVDPLRAAISKRDGEAAAAVIRSLSSTVEEHTVQARAFVAEGGALADGTERR
ncbi:MULTISPECIES: GntR family transcriptional regulator [unclassified Curtobacterium]|uniref:GntR family transcriptional regulator n=1 Tax=Bacteria TaxID=2 RepID=UPI000F48EC21|nr:MULTISPECIES: GntR family transcriptional regulator [unclassified Curtobacterium]NQW91641.1 GntR family transcriptional regulator [Curtobacterium sp. VKM Ac-2861]MBF4586937.1 GntR family transcriptional regulator [Curtobacterium sp. VKM Ac-2887]ROQ16667.1 GntR family transcriptional regulator [Curtobacterium sp. PhB171]ROQ25257.1 GntR family transcriptional regulator [Curtobacterium sp. PhB170]ROS33793.1 GntR family transcriptional regulator [Curtobacterium sp. PhB78]